jgi:hypothetical protein
MLELIAIICAIATCFWVPIEVSKLRNGTNKKLATDREAVLAGWRKQLKVLMWTGAGLGGINVVLGLVASDNAAERLDKLVVGTVWLAVFVVCYLSSRQIPESAPASTEATNATDVPRTA